MSGPWSLRYRKGTALADQWGTGPTGSFATRAEAEWVRKECPNAIHMDVVETDADGEES